MSAVLERDVVHRAGQLGRSGWEPALRGLSPQLRWRDRAVEVLRHADDTQRLAGQGLLLVPSVFVWPGIAVFLEEPWPRALVYPARGSAALWQAPPVVPGALARLLGAGRAQVLGALDSPASTTHLVRLLDLSLGTVGGHLAALRDTGLVRGSRSGRSVLYTRTPVGDALVEAVGYA